jgi:hypothetical protein
MPTQLITVTDQWTEIVDDPSTEFLATSESLGELHYATTAIEAAPTIPRGHVVQGREAMSRSLIGQGRVWSRTSGESIILAVSK